MIEEKQQDAFVKISVSYDEHEDGKTIKGMIEEFLSRSWSPGVRSIAVGNWGESYEKSSAEAVELLAAARDKLPNLRWIFIGDMELEECEISWIKQSDVSPLLEAFPQLEELRIRGSQELRMEKPVHARLKTLVIECGGLPKEVLADLKKAQFPELQHLELYLGEENYGFSGGIEDVRPLMEKGRFPKLKYLGLRDSEIADQVAKEIANASILDQIETLDLSLGNMGDEGAEALLASEKIANLKSLVLNHHFMSKKIMKKIKKLEKKGLEVDCSNQLAEEKWDGETYRYIAVSE